MFATNICILILVGEETSTAIIVLFKVIGVENFPSLRRQIHEVFKDLKHIWKGSSYQVEIKLSKVKYKENFESS